MRTLRAGSKIGCYELIKLLGEGGMGEVWLAHDERADRSVALKFIQPHLLHDPKMRVRFTNEARTLGKLEHDRIVTLYAVLEEDEYLAFVLRFIEGQSLAERIRLQFPLPMSFIVSSARDILSALAEAHQHGIIHRDIKPQNILIDRKDRSFLADFGIAVTDFLERATVGAFAIGTPHYMSPEQIVRPGDLTIAKGGQRTDIYSYGVVLYEMLTGRVPFGNDMGPEQIFTIQQAHCQDPPPPLRNFNHSVSPAMESVVLHCLEKDPGLRPQSCTELLNEIEAAAQGVIVPRSATTPMAAASATILEPGRAPGMSRQRSTVLQSAQDRASPQPGAHASRTPQRWIAIAAATVVLSAALGFAWYSFRSKPSTGAAPAGAASTQPVTTGISGAKPPNTTPGQQTKLPQVQPGTAHPDVAHLGSAPAEAINPHNNPEHAAAIPPPSSGPVETPEMKQAADLAAQADTQFKAGEYCQALATLNEAIDLYSDPKYVSRRASYARGCNLQ